MCATAWEAMIVASVDSPTSGYCAHDGASRKNGARAAAGSWMIRAPWPK
jgi:hypothetical protein